MKTDRLESRISRLLAAGTYLSVTILAIGVVIALARPDAPAAGFDAATILNAGLALVILTPVARVAASAIGFAGRGERELAAISVSVLIVLGLTVVVAAVTA